MSTKEYLRQIYCLDKSINCKLEQVAALRDLAHKTTTTLSFQPAAKSGVHSKTEDCIVRIIDLENKINDELDKMIGLKDDVIQAIQTVQSPEYRLMLELRYINFKTWEQIADIMNYSVRTIYYIHGNALLEIKTLQ